MIGHTIPHYPDKSHRDAKKPRKILEKPPTSSRMIGTSSRTKKRDRSGQAPKDSGQVGGGGMFENCPRTLSVSGSNFQNPAVLWREVMP
jgi:hypothetical protein